jgi:hypothetical protein
MPGSADCNPPTSPPSIWTLARAQAALADAACQLLAVVDLLEEVYHALPPPADLADRQEGRKAYDIATDILATIECVLADDLRPAVETLQRSASVTDTELERQFEEWQKRQRISRPRKPDEEIREGKILGQAFAELPRRLTEAEPARRTQRLMAPERRLRRLTVTNRYRPGGPVPEIRTSGKWLARMGFPAGSRLAIMVECSRLVVTVHSRPRPLPHRSGRKARVNPES